MWTQDRIEEEQRQVKSIITVLDLRTTLINLGLKLSMQSLRSIKLFHDKYGKNEL